MKVAWKFSTMGSGGQYVMMTSPFTLLKWCAENLAFWMLSPGPPQPSTEKEKVKSDPISELSNLNDIQLWKN